MQQETSVFALAKQIDLADFIESAGNCKLRKTPTGLRGSWCPACGQSSAASTKLWINKGWYCQSCGMKGDIIEAAGHFYGVPDRKLEAARKLVEDFKPGAAISLQPRTYMPAQDDPEEIALRAAQRKIISHLSDVLKNVPLNQAAVEYLHKDRKIKIQTLHEAQARGLLITLPSSPGDVTKFLLEHFTQKELIDARFWGLHEDNTPKRMPAIAYRPIVFVSQLHQAAEFRLAHPPVKDEPKGIRYGKGDWWVWEGTDAGKAVIVEGCIDLLSAVDLGANSTIFGIPGCNCWQSWPDEKFALLAPNVKIMLDNDDTPKNPGQKWAMLLLERLAKTGRQVANWAPPPGKDLNDLLKHRVASIAT